MLIHVLILKSTKRCFFQGLTYHPSGLPRRRYCPAPVACLRSFGGVWGSFVELWRVVNPHPLLLTLSLKVASSALVNHCRTCGEEWSQLPDLSKSFFFGRFSPVSYTHLDVYKRQLFLMLVSNLPRNSVNFCSFILFILWSVSPSIASMSPR